MKKLLLGVAIIYLALTGLMNSVKANDYSTAVIGHVIQNHKQIDHGKLLEVEMNRLMHSISIEMVSILQAYLPAILDGVMSDLRLQADEKYKCALLEGSKIEDDCK